MVANVTRSLTIDKKKYKELQKYGYNINEIFDIACDLLLGDDMQYYNYGYCINLERRRLREEKHNVDMLKEHADAAQIAYEKALREYDERECNFNEIVNRLSNIESTLVRSKILSELNDLIINANYDLMTIKITCKTWIEQMQKIDETFNIEDHVNALRMFMN